MIDRKSTPDDDDDDDNDDEGGNFNRSPWQRRSVSYSIFCVYFSEISRPGTVTSTNVYYHYLLAGRYYVTERCDARGTEKANQRRLGATTDGDRKTKTGEHKKKKQERAGASEIRRGRGKYRIRECGTEKERYLKAGITKRVVVAACPSRAESVIHH